MKLKFSKIVNKESKRAEILLSGILGDADKQTNGHYWAQEFRWLDKNYDEVTVLINGDGGSIVHGLSIVAAILGATSKVTTRTVGIAASMLAVIAVLGDKVEINDYAKLMFHSPYYEDENGDKAKGLSAKAKKALMSLKDTLTNLLMKRGKTEEEITKILKTDTWYNADEAKAEDFVDEVIQTGRKELAALEPMALVAKLNDEYKPKKERKMKTVIAALGLPEDTEEQAVLEVVNKLQKDGGQAPDLSKVVDKLIVVAKAHNKVTDKNEASMRKLAETDLGLFMDVLNLEESTGTPAATTETTRVSDALAALNKGKGKGDGKAEEKTFGWYEQNDPDALAQMERSDPTKFKALEDADNAQY